MKRRDFFKGTGVVIIGGVTINFFLPDQPTIATETEFSLSDVGVLESESGEPKEILITFNQLDLEFENLSSQTDVNVFIMATINETEEELLDESLSVDNPNEFYTIEDVHPDNESQMEFNLVDKFGTQPFEAPAWEIKSTDVEIEIIIEHTDIGTEKFDTTFTVEVENVVTVDIPDSIAVQENPPDEGDREDGEIWTIEELDDIREDEDADYELMRHLDFEEDWAYDDPSNMDDYITGDGWEPIYLDGSLDGNGYAIANLFIDRDDEEDGVGLIGTLERDGTVEQIGVVDVDVTGDRLVGGLVGRAFGDVSESYATGVVEGDEDVGGLVGYNNFDDASESYATSNVDGDEDVGGLIGRSLGDVIDSYWDVDSSGTEESDGGTGLNSIEMQGSEAESNMDGFDFTDTWTLEYDDEILEVYYPFLRNNDLEAQIVAQRVAMEEIDLSWELE